MPTQAAAALRAAPRHLRHRVPPRIQEPRQPVVTLAHHRPDTDALVLVTCTCRRLRTAVDVDDPLALSFVLTEHLQQHLDTDHLLLEDTRTGRLSAWTADGAPDLVLTLNPPRTRKDAP